MPENLRITTPIPNNDGIRRPTSAAESIALNAANPVRVNRPDAREQGEDTGSMDLLLSRDSVFSRFVQQLRQTPSLSETLGRLLAGTVGRDGAAATVLPRESPLRLLASSIAAGKEDMVEELSSQQKDSTLFSAPLFRLLSRISERNGDAQFDLRLAEFLKAFDGYFSAPHTLSAILANLETIARQVPAPYAKKLAQLSEKLDIADPASPANPDLLKKEILPLLSEHVSQNSDYGKMREALSLLLHNTSILNVSSRQNLSEKFARLMDYCSRSLPEPTMKLMRSFYEEAVRSGAEARTGARSVPADGDAPRPGQPADAAAGRAAPGKEGHSRFAESLISFLSDGGGEGTGGDILHSLLLDNSVYMPFTHLYLPAVWQGRFLFSQIWIEKRENGESSPGEPDEQEKRPLSLYLTFDIQDLGYFEARVALAGKKTDIRLSCPTPLLGRSGEITSSLGRILDRNGLQAGEIRLSAGEEPEIPGIILQKILERKRIVDVTV